MIIINSVAHLREVVTRGECQLQLRIKIPDDDDERLEISALLQQLLDKDRVNMLMFDPPTNIHSSYQLFSELLSGIDKPAPSLRSLVFTHPREEDYENTAQIDSGDIRGLSDTLLKFPFLKELNLSCFKLDTDQMITLSDTLQQLSYLKKFEIFIGLTKNLSDELTASHNPEKFAEITSNLKLPPFLRTLNLIFDSRELSQIDDMFDFMTYFPKLIKNIGDKFPFVSPKTCDYAKHTKGPGAVMLSPTHTPPPLPTISELLEDCEKLLAFYSRKICMEPLNQDEPAAARQLATDLLENIENRLSLNREDAPLRIYLLFQKELLLLLKELDNTIFSDEPQDSSQFIEKAAKLLNSKYAKMFFSEKETPSLMAAIFKRISYLCSNELTEMADSAEDKEGRIFFPDKEKQIALFNLLQYCELETQISVILIETWRHERKTLEYFSEIPEDLDKSEELEDLDTIVDSKIQEMRNISIAPLMEHAAEGEDIGNPEDILKCIKRDILSSDLAHKFLSVISEHRLTSSLFYQKMLKLIISPITEQKLFREALLTLQEREKEIEYISEDLDKETILELRGIKTILPFISKLVKIMDGDDFTKHDLNYIVQNADQMHQILEDEEDEAAVKLNINPDEKTLLLSGIKAAKDFTNHFMHSLPSLKLPKEPKKPEEPAAAAGKRWPILGLLASGAAIFAGVATIFAITFPGSGLIAGGLIAAGAIGGAFTLAKIIPKMIRVRTEKAGTLPLEEAEASDVSQPEEPSSSRRIAEHLVDKIRRSAEKENVDPALLAKQISDILREREELPPIRRSIVIEEEYEGEEDKPEIGRRRRH